MKPSAPLRVSLAVFLAVLFSSITPDAPAQTNPAYLAGTIAKDEPQAIYADGLQDSWNRIFYCLSTRTLKVRLSDEFPEGAPFETTNHFLGGSKPISTQVFERIESGDHAVEPLYPHEMFRRDVSTARVLDEPRFSMFHQALEDALNEPTTRPPLQRALMQSDAWAAYDFLQKDVTSWILPHAPIETFTNRQAQLRPLLARLVRKLALTPEEIRALPDNFAFANVTPPFPQLFATNGEWLEVVWLTNREHDLNADFRRVSRVFIRPLKPPRNKAQFVKDLEHKGGPFKFNQLPDYSGNLASVALVTQDLLVDTMGQATPSPLTCSVQVRNFVRNAHGEIERAEFLEYELSRRQLLKQPASGGFTLSNDTSPAYLGGAGNDYSYAPPIARDAAVLGSMHARCAGCHGGNGSVVFTFLLGHPSGLHARLLDPAANDRAIDVSIRKTRSKPFQAMMEAGN